MRSIWQADNRLIGCRCHNAENHNLNHLKFQIVGWDSPLGTAATTGLLDEPQKIDNGDYGAIGGMKIGRGNWSTRKKPAPAPLGPPQIHMNWPGLESGPQRWEASDYRSWEATVAQILKQCPVSYGVRKFIAMSTWDFGMVRPQVDDGRGGRQIENVAPNILQNHPQAESKGWSSSFGIVCGASEEK
jgi:hypothetical protein